MNSTHAPALDLLRGVSMGTTWSVQLAASGHDLHVLHARVQQALDTVVAQMSTWEAESDISRFNRAQPGWVRLPKELFQVLDHACAVAACTDGAFDPTLGALVGMWGFGAQADTGLPPGPDAVLQTLATTGWRKLRLDATTCSAWQPGQLQLDLSAIAKGFGVDWVTQALRALGIGHALIDVGGELFALGHKPDGTPWRVLVESDPERDRSDPAVVALADCAIATSGDRWHRHAHAGSEHAHTLDPRTGTPLARPPLAVTVIAATAMQADAWATALSVMGPQAGLQFARAHALAVRFVLADATPSTYHSPAFAPYLARP